MTGEGVNLPFAAWEQAVFVALFVVFCIALVAGLLNWFTRQQNSWQKFIQERDKDWQAWMDRSEARGAEQMAGVVRSLEHLSEKLEEHDRHVDERIEAVRRNPRSK